MRVEAVKSDGTAWHWGDGGRTPEQYLGVINAKKIYNTYVLTANGTLTNVSGTQIGVWTDIVAATDDASYVVTASGDVYETASNLKMDGISDVKDIRGSEWEHTMFLKNDGTVWAMGDNFYGQLGDGTTTHRSSPVQVQDLNDVIAISADPHVSMVLKSDGTVWMWGMLMRGGLGIGLYGWAGDTYYSHPQKVHNLTNIIAIANGFDHSLALQSDGTVWTWGYGAGGQNGDGTYETYAAPIKIPNFSWKTGNTPPPPPPPGAKRTSLVPMYHLLLN